MKISDFCHFDFNRFNRGNWAIYLWFPYYTTCWWTKENWQTMKKCLVWLVEVIKVNCIFQNFDLKILKPSETSKKILVPQKNLKSSKNYLYLIYLFDKTTEKKGFYAPKGTIFAISAKSEKGVRLCYTACMGLPWKI